MTIYGWYSKEAFKINKIGYLYSDSNGIPKLCTIVSQENICPYYQPLNIFRENIKFVGELKKFICLIHYCEGEESEKIEQIIKDYNTFEILNNCMNNRYERLFKLGS
tara:strand:+ start:1157 stop:1477 length:321 start_codon:yes stop_codon:yes gene_type:complete